MGRTGAERDRPQEAFGRFPVDARGRSRRNGCRGEVPGLAGLLPSRRAARGRPVGEGQGPVDARHDHRQAARLRHRRGGHGLAGLSQADQDPAGEAEADGRCPEGGEERLRMAAAALGGVPDRCGQEHPEHEADPGLPAHEDPGSDEDVSQCKKGYEGLIHCPTLADPSEGSTGRLVDPSRVCMFNT